MTTEKKKLTIKDQPNFEITLPEEIEFLGKKYLKLSFRPANPIIVKKYFRWEISKKQQQSNPNIETDPEGDVALNFMMQLSASNIPPEFFEKALTGEEFSKLARNFFNKLTDTSGSIEEDGRLVFNFYPKYSFYTKDQDNPKLVEKIKFNAPLGKDTKDFLNKAKDSKIDVLITNMLAKLTAEPKLKPKDLEAMAGTDFNKLMNHALKKAGVI